MHEQSLQHMQNFVEKYLDKSKRLNIIDIGSYNDNGCYKPYFDNPTWKYTGLDLYAGPNVDIIADSVNKYPVGNEVYDVVISGQTLEHVEDMYAWIKEVNRILTVDGIVCIIVPCAWGEHRYPLDCWRVYPDGMKFLLGKIGELELIDVFCIPPDTVGIAKKVKGMYRKRRR